MNSEISTQTRSSTEESIRRMTFRLGQLKAKMLGFSVVDSQGRFVGEVTDLVLDEQQSLKLVISQPDVNQGKRFILLPSRLVVRVRSRSQTLLVNLSQAEIRNFPEYTPPMQPMNQEGQESLGPVIIEQDDQAQEIYLNSTEALENQPIPVQAQGPIEHTDAPKVISEEVVQEEAFRLLEERLRVDYSKRKVGEVVVRKEIETHIIEVPVRREKLIVEQVGSETKRLAEIDLGQGEISGLELRDPLTNHYKNSQTISGEFASPKTVSWLLDTIAHQSQHGCKRIRVEIELDDASHYELYKGWFDRCSIRKES